MSDEKRKATDILLSNERKLDEILSFVRNIDNTVKIVLGRLNVQQPARAPQRPAPSVSADPVEQAPPVPQNALKKPPEGGFKFQDLPKTNKFEQLKEKFGVTDDSKPLTDDERFELTEETVAQGQRRGQRVDKRPSTRTSVSQFVYNDGKPVPIAIVCVFDEDGQNMIIKKRTNTVGRWTAPLEPGIYQIHILKTSEEEGRPHLEDRFLVEVPESKQFTLPNKDFNEGN